MCYLISKDVVMDVVLLNRLRCENEGLHEPSHWLTLVRQLPTNLNDHPGPNCVMGIHLAYLGLAFSKVKLHDALMDLLLSINLLDKEKRR